MSAPIYTLDNVAYATPDGRMLQSGISARVSSGQLFLISGPNGSGKSTLLKAILGKMRVSRGTLLCSIHDSEIAFLPQLENTEVHLPVTLRDVLQIARSASDDVILAIGLLRREQLGSAWNTASGGERKRTLLTRAILSHPSVLILDEPMNHLDSESRKVMIAALAKFLNFSNANRAVVMVCHQGLHDDERKLFDVVALPLTLQEGNN